MSRRPITTEIANPYSGMDTQLHILRTTTSPLEKVITLKRLLAEIGKVTESLIPEANAEYKQKVLSAAGAKSILVASAVLTKNTKAGTWTYPPELVTLKADLSAKEKAYQTAHPEAKTEPEYTEKDQAFKIALVATT